MASSQKHFNLYCCLRFPLLCKLALLLDPGNSSRVHSWCFRVWASPTPTAVVARFPPMLWHMIIDPFLRKFPWSPPWVAYATALAETFTSADDRPEITGTAAKDVKTLPEDGVQGSCQAKARGRAGTRCGYTASDTLLTRGLRSTNRTCRFIHSFYNTINTKIYYDVAT